MTTIRNVTSRLGFSMPWATAQDGKRNPGGLTFEARGVLAYLLSKPNDWIIQIEDLMAEGGIGRDKVKKILKELRDAQYLKTEMRQDDTGRFIGKIDRLHEIVHRDTEIQYSGDRDTEKPSNGLSNVRDFPPIHNRDKEQNKEKEPAAKAPVVSPTAKAGSYQALSGKTDAECEAERIALAEQQRVIDERRLLGNGHVAQLEIDVKHFLGLSGTLATKYARMLYGRLSTKGKKSKPEDNAFLEQSALLRDAPITPDEFTGWAEEYCRTAKVTPGAPTMIKAPEKLVSSILARRERLATGTSTNAANFGAPNWQPDFWDTFDGKVGA